MSAAGRVRGSPRIPPSWLGDRSLPLRRMSRKWYRCAVRERPLVEWDCRATSRFSGPGLPFSSLYLAEDPATAFWECFGDDLLDRATSERAVSSAAFASREIVEFLLPAAWRFLDVTSATVQRAIGADGSTFRSGYSVTQAWAKALMEHRSSPWGLLYESRLNDGRKCLALWGRPGLQPDIQARVLHPLSDDTAVLEAMFRNRVAILP